jgi:hypothetical protein
MAAFSRSVAITPLARAESLGVEVEQGVVIERPEEVSIKPVPTGIFIYLCSGEVRKFPTATNIVLTALAISVFSADIQVATFPRKEVWSASEQNTCPVPS